MCGYLVLSSTSFQPTKPHIRLTSVICNLGYVPGWSVFRDSLVCSVISLEITCNMSKLTISHQRHWIFDRLDKGTSFSFSDSAEDSAREQLQQRSKIYRSSRSTLESQKLFSVVPCSNSAGHVPLFVSSFRISPCIIKPQDIHLGAGNYRGSGRQRDHVQMDSTNGSKEQTFLGFYYSKCIYNEWCMSIFVSILLSTSRALALVVTATTHLFMGQNGSSFASSFHNSFPLWVCIIRNLLHTLGLPHSKLTLLPSSRPPPCGSSHSSLGAVLPAVTGQIGPSELRHLGAPSLVKWMAGSGQSDVEPLHQGRRP